MRSAGAPISITARLLRAVARRSEAERRPIKITLVASGLRSAIDRKKASHEGFSYSSGLQAKGGDWTYEDINHMIFKPTAYVKGTKMAFAGIKNETEIANLWAYLKQFKADGKTQ